MGRKKIERVFLEKKCEICESIFTVFLGTRSELKRFCSGLCAKKFIGLSNKGKKHTDESRKKRSISSMGENNPFYGKTHTPEAKQEISKKKIGISWEEIMGPEKSNERKEKQSEKYSGEGNPFYAKEHTDESKSKITAAYLKNGDWAGENNPKYGNGHLIKGELNPAWKGGTSSFPYSEYFTDELKTKIRQRDNFTCEICKKNGYDVHHINYDKQQSDSKNLITLCRSCHAKTNFNREAWKAYFYTIMENKIDI